MSDDHAQALLRQSGTPPSFSVAVIGAKESERPRSILRRVRRQVFFSIYGE